MAAVRWVTPGSQLGLTLGHLSAQPDPFLSLLDHTKPQSSAKAEKPLKAKLNENPELKLQ
jgi:hypothetical protein